MTATLAEYRAAIGRAAAVVAYRHAEDELLALECPLAYECDREAADCVVSKADWFFRAEGFRATRYTLEAAR